MNQSPLILFDFDGVVADSLEVFFSAFSAVCGDLGYTKLTSRDAFLSLFEGNAIFGLIRRGFTLRKLKQLGEQFKPRIQEMNEQVEPFADMPELLRDLARRHPVYVITSNNTDAILSFLEKHQIDGILDVIGSDKETSKVKKIKAVAGRHPECTPYYIGDTKGDMTEARKAGAIPVAVSWGWHTVEKLKEGRPAHIVDSPRSLAALFD